MTNQPTELTNDQIKHLVELAGVDTPILSYKVTGSQVELHLLGGAVAQVTAEWLLTEEETANLLQDLGSLAVDQLRILAGKLEITGISKMKKPQLLQAIQEAKANKNELPQ